LTLFPTLLILCGDFYSEPPAPPIGGYNVYMGHIHNHTAYSDGRDTPFKAYQYARDIAGMDFLGITDHDHQIDGAEWKNTARAALMFNQDYRFTAFRGFEWTSPYYGHVSILETEDYVSSRDEATDSFDELCAWIGDTDGIAFFNHPGRQKDYGNEFNHFAARPVDNFAGIELWNRNSGFDVYYYNDGFMVDDGNLGYYDEALRRGWRIGSSGSGDDHDASWGTAQPSRLAVLANFKTRREILSAFRARRFYSTLDKNLSLSFKIDGNEMGSIVEPGVHVLEISVDDGSDDDKFSAVDLIRDGAMINSWFPGRKQANMTAEITVLPGEYYYIRVMQSDGDEAISSPIWIE